MKKVFFFILLFFIFIQGWCNPVDENTARKVAQNFWLQYCTNKAECVLQTVPTLNEFPQLYVFNVKDQEGFIIVSAEDCASPILAYSTEGYFDVNKLPAPVQSWLGNYCEEISWTKTQNLDNSDTQAEWQQAIAGKYNTKGGDRIQFLMKTLWDQGEYYNALCPPASERCELDNVYVGCVGVALAQVLRYWSYPPYGKGSYYYSFEDNPGAPYWNYGTIGADFENTHYDWKNMPVKLSASSSEEEVMAVATLMYHAGISIQTNYNCTNTGASDACLSDILVQDTSYNPHGHTESAESALRKFWRYKPSLKGLLKEGYTDGEWIALIRNELSNGRPILYRAEGSAGHAFVLDGIDQADRCHFNWGWGGSANGYYVVSTLKVYNYDFSQKHSGIFGVEPDGEISRVDDFANDNYFTVLAREKELVITLPEHNELRIYDALGRLLHHSSASEGTSTVQIPTSGLYLVQVGSHTKKVLVR